MHEVRRADFLEQGKQEFREETAENEQNEELNGRDR